LMNMQSQTLASEPLESSNVSVLAIASGKGGVGKTSISSNLAISLAKLDNSVMLFDADLGLANVDIALGIKPKYTIDHVIRGEKTLEEVIVEGPAGVRIVPAASGVARMAALSESEQAGLIRSFSDISEPVDHLIVDISAGIDSNVLSFVSACQDVIVVVCDEPSSITDAYALIKVLNRERGNKSVKILANMVVDEGHGRVLCEKITKVVDRFLDVQISYLGAVPYDDYMKKAVKQQKAVTIAYPSSESARAIKSVAEKIDRAGSASNGVGGLGFFVERLIEQEAKV